MTGTGDRRHRDKVLPLAEIGRRTAEARARGEKTVLAHGVFDLLHLGHIRHLEEARGKGDVLVVTVTADPYVNKGPGRPAFSHAMRAEVLAALEFVDYVGINEAASAEPVIEAVKPDVYIKGAEYQRDEDDITGKIVQERRLVEKHGGRLEFSEGLVFSSTFLINRFLNVFDSRVRSYLDEERDTYGADRYVEWLDRITDMRVLIIGDAIIDEYQYVTPLGRSPKENMIATQFHDRELFAGGVFAAANHVAELCREVEVLTLLGGAESHRDTITAALKSNIRLSHLVRPGAPTTRKTRFVERGHYRKLFEVYHMDDSPLPDALRCEVDAMLAERIAAADLVIVTDFGHGLIGPSTIARLTGSGTFLAVNAQSNSANMGFNLISRYPRADFVCIDAPEARLAAGDKTTDMATLLRQRFPSLVDCPRMIVTHGKQGCVTFERDGAVRSIPALTDQVVDTVGAGDAFFVVAAPLVAAGMPVDKAGFIGNIAGAIKVGILGHRRSVERVQIIKSIKGLLH